MQKFIVKLFPEIMVKGRSAKRQMVDQLFANLQKILHRIDTQITVRKFSDKIEVFTPKSTVAEVRLVLTQTPGIEQVLEALQFTQMDTLEKIKETVGAVVADSLEGKRFAVRAKRAGTHDFTSIDIERTVGGFLKAHSKAAGIDLGQPEVTVRLELRDAQLNIVTASYKGLGGYPLGTQGDILSLMSGGFDSTVASYLTMKRGIKTHFVFFNLGGLAHEIGVKQVALYLWSKFGSSHRVKFISVPFEAVVEEIFRSTAPSYMGVTLKRQMLRAAEKIADTMEIDALLTGESVAQVSSQTLRNLALIDRVTDKLVLRPLATMNKPEIIALAEEIGTRRFAESMPEYCGVISQNPVTHGSFKRMEREARKFDGSVLDAAVADAKTIDIDTVVADIEALSAVTVVHEADPEKHVVIDIRPEPGCVETACETLKIPFYELNSAFDRLPKDKEYLLYCDKGVMSQLHAQYLRDGKKCDNVKVYRPRA